MIDPQKLQTAYNAGVAWVRGLKPGDKFTGAMPAAKECLQTVLEQRVFMNAALDQVLYVSTHEDGTIKEVKYREDAPCRD